MTAFVIEIQDAEDGPGVLTPADDGKVLFWDGGQKRFLAGALRSSGGQIVGHFGGMNIQNASDGPGTMTVANDGQSLVWSNTAGRFIASTVDASDADTLDGLDSSDFVLLAGRAGGQTVIGGTGTTDDLTLRSTSGVGATGADIIFQTGNNGATEAMRIGVAGDFGVGIAVDPTIKFYLNKIITNDASAIQRVAYIYLGSTGTVPQNKQLYGLQFEVERLGSGAVSSQTYGVYGVVRLRPTANVTNSAIGIFGKAAVNTPSGTTTVVEIIGVEAQASNENTTGVTVTSSYGMRILSAVASSTITTVYGMFIQSQSVGTNNFALVTNIGNVVLNETGDANTNFRVEGDTDINLLFTQASTDRAGVGTSTPATKFEVLLTDTGTTDLVNVATVSRRGGTPGVGFGVGLAFRLESSTTNDQDAGRVTFEWVTATHASRAAAGKLTAFSVTNERTALYWLANSTDVTVGVGQSATLTAALNIVAPSTTRASMRLLTGTAPTTPNDGDFWHDGALTFMAEDATTAAIVDTLRLRRGSSGTPAVGFGVGFSARLKSSTTANQDAGRLTWKWNVATHASREAYGQLTAFYTTTERPAITWGANSTVALLSFYDVTTPIARQVLATGAGATVDQVISALQALGLVKQS